MRIYSCLPTRCPWAVDAQCVRCGDFPGLREGSDTDHGDTTALDDMGICNNGCRAMPTQREQEAHMRRLAEAQRNPHLRAGLQSLDCGSRPCAC